MTAMALLLAATLLSSLQDETAETRAAGSADVAAETVAATNAPAASGKTVTITASHADYDRRDGVIFFEGNVVVADPEFDMHADRLHVFVDQLNQLKRIVVSGRVAITNELKSGMCDRATYDKRLHRVVMFGLPGQPARLVDDSKKRSVVEGAKITFWTDSEQVEVDDTTITLEGGMPAADALNASRGGETKKDDLTAKTEKKETKRENKK